MRKLILAISITLIILSFLGCSSETKNNISKTNPNPVVTGNNEIIPSNEPDDQNSKKVTLNLYFANADNSAVPKEKREVVVKDGALLRTAVEALLEGPKTPGYNKIIPDGTKVLGIKKDGTTAVVDFSKEYASLNDIAEIVERISVVNTLTDIEGIESVRILVEGKDLIGPSGEPFGLITKAALDDNGRPIPGEVKTIVLYYGNSNAEAVVAEKRSVTVNKGELLEKVVFEELQKEPKTSGLYPVVPEKTKLLSIETSKDGTCTINLSKEFISNAPGGSAGESMTLNGVVDTLTELPYIKRVQFLIEGKKQDVYIQNEFDQPFTRDENSIQK